MMRSVTTCDINAVCAARPSLSSASRDVQVVNNVNAAVAGELRQALSNNLAESRRVYSNWLSHPKHLVGRFK